LLARWDGANRGARPDEGDGEVEVVAVTDEASSPCRPFLVNLEQAVELGLINSREYQDRREDLYMTALPVTLQRGALVAQPWATEQAFRERTGRQTPEGQHNRFRFDTNVGFGQLFSTGALLLMNIANETIVELSGPFRHTTSQSVLSLDLIQPLLRGGGRAVTLEPLTQSERNLLYQVRSYARFRKEFFVAVAGGGGGSISGGVFVPQGVIAPTPFSPTGGLGASNVVPGVIPPVTADVNRLQQTPGPSGRLNL